MIDKPIKDGGSHTYKSEDFNPEETEDNPGRERVASQRGDQETEGTDGETGSPLI